MKHHFPFFLMIIPVGILMMVFALIFILNLEHIVSAAGSLFFGANQEHSRSLFYIAAALVPVISGIVMGVAVVMISKHEDREYEQLWQETQDGASAFYGELTRYFDSIDASIIKLRDASEKIKHQGEKMEELGRHMAEQNGPSAVRAENPPCSVTLVDNKITNLRIIHPVDELILQAPAPLPQSHQKIWFFPHK